MNGLISLAAGLILAIAAGGLWAWFVRKKKPSETIVITGWGFILALVLVVLFLDLYLPSS